MLDGKLYYKEETEKLLPRPNIRGGGVLILGQDQDVIGGGFQDDQSMCGEISHLMIWDVAIEESILKNLEYIRYYLNNSVITLHRTDLWKLNGTSTEWTKRPKSNVFGTVSIDGILKFFPVPLTLREHIRICEQCGGSLGVPISTGEEQVLLEEIKLWNRKCTSRLFGFSVWLGITDEVVENEWLTFEGIPLNFSKWFAEQNEPNGETDENCAVLKVDSNFEGFWFDVACDDEKLCASCRFRQTPVLKIRGPPLSSSMLDTFYVLPSEPTEYFQLIGFQQSDLVLRQKDTYALVSGNVTFATWKRSNTIVNPLGRHLWKAQKNSEVIISISVCKDDEFSCSSGQCVPIKNRCDVYIQCSDGTDEENCSLVNIPSNYQKALPPPPLSPTEYELQTIKNFNIDTEKTPIPLFIYVFINIARILSIDVIQMEITLEFNLLIQWRDSRLQFYNLASGENENNLNSKESKTIWTPEIDFVNARGSVHTLIDEDSSILIEKLDEGSITDETNSYEDIEHSGFVNVIKMKRNYNVTFTCPLDLTSYPFDKQTCELLLQASSTLLSNMMILKKGAGAVYSGKKSLIEYEVQKISFAYPPNSFVSNCNQDGNQENVINQHLHNCTVSENLGSSEEGSLYSQLVVIIELRRLYQFFLFSTFIPTSLMVVIAYLTFFYPMDDFNDRIMVSLTSLLVLSSLFNQSSSSLPKTSYLKLVDVWFLSSIIFIFLIILIQTILDMLRKDNGNSGLGKIVPGFQNAVEKSKERKIITFTRKFNAWMEKEVLENELSPSSVKSKHFEKSKKSQLPEISKRTKHYNWKLCSKWSKVLFPLVFAIFILFYWTLSLKKYYGR